MKPKGLSIKTRIGLRTWHIGRTALLVLPIALMQAIVIAVVYLIVRSDLLRIAKTMLVLIDLWFGESLVYGVWFVLQEKFMDYQAFRQKVARETKRARLHQELLTNDPDEEVRLAAVEKVYEINRLNDIALNDENWRVRAAAAAGIHHPGDAEALLRASGDPDVRMLAMLKICDVAVLREYALNDPDYRVRAAAAGKIESPEILLEIIDGEQSESVWRVCLPKLIRKSKVDGIIPENVRTAIRNAKYVEKMLNLKVCPDCGAEVFMHEECRDVDIDNISEYDDDPILVEHYHFYKCSGCRREEEWRRWLEPFDRGFAVPLASILDEADKKAEDHEN
ncbi:MAG: HEAT repeat domain-containing protein [Christensenella sp.]